MPRRLAQQDLLDQLVKLLDVALDSGAQRRVAVLRLQLHCHADAGKRRAQLVGGSGEGVALCVHQRLDTLGRAVEAARQRGDLVLALHIDPGAEIAGAQRLDPGLQPLESPREATGERPGTDGDGEREDGEGGEEADRRHAGETPVRAKEDEAAVRDRHGEGAATPRTPARGPLLGRRQRLAYARQQLALRPEHADAAVDLPTQADQRGIERGRGRLWRRQRLGDQRGDAPAELRIRGLVVGEPPDERGEHAEQHDNAEHRQVELEEEAAPHGPSSWRRAKR